MPGLNQEGPTGQGPMTGRKMGRCTNFGVGRRCQTTQNTIMDTPATDFTPGQGAGRGMGRGMGRGLGRGTGQNSGGRGMGSGRQNRFQGDK